jgi:S-disulfanyl-L-cysteine oxidoreductase SoxD
MTPLTYTRTLRLALAAVVVGAAACRLDSRDDYLGDKDPKQFNLGHTASAAEIAAVNIDVSPDGVGLPAGSGTPEQGAKVFAASCASCHGASGEGKPPAYPQLVGGPKNPDFDADLKIPRTIGNYWPYATTLFDYIRRAMPLTAPGSLSDEQTYAVTAYLLEREGIIPANTPLDAKSLAAIQMPAKSHFVNDNRRGSIGGKNVR